MAHSVSEVYRLEEELRAPSFVAAQKELEELQKFAHDSGHSGQLKHWDIAYWAKRLQEQKYSYSEEELRPYFSLPKVLDGLFALVEKIFEIKVQKSTRDVSTWNSDVSFYDIFDKSGNHISSFYLRSLLST